MSDDEREENGRNADERDADALYVYLSNAQLPDMECSRTCKHVLLYVTASKSLSAVILSGRVLKVFRTFILKKSINNKNKKI